MGRTTTSLALAGARLHVHCAALAQLVHVAPVQSTPMIDSQTRVADEHTSAASTLFDHVDSCASIVAAPSGAGVATLRYALFLRCTTAMGRSATQRAAAATLLLRAAAALSESPNSHAPPPSDGGRGSQAVPPSADSTGHAPDLSFAGSLFAAVHTALASSVDSLAAATTDLTALRRDTLPSAALTAFQRLDADIAAATRDLHSALADVVTLSALSHAWNGRTHTSAGDASPLFPLSLADADALAPVLRSAAGHAQNALTAVEHGGGSGAAWGDAGPDVALGIARPLAALALLQLLGGGAIAAEGLLATALTAPRDSIRLRSGSEMAALPPVQGAIAAGSESAAAAAARRLPALYRVAVAGHLHLRGALLRQWEKREAEGMREAGSADAALNDAAEQLGATFWCVARSDGSGDARDARQFLRRRAFVAALAAIPGGSVASTLPGDLTCLRELTRVAL